MEGPWIWEGDFNIVQTSEEKQGEEHPTNGAIRDFNECILVASTK